MSTVIGVINRSKRVTNVDVEKMSRACDEQIRRHVAPEWDCLPWRVRCYPTVADLPRDCLPIVLFDRASDPEDLGFHSEDRAGRRYGRVFVNPIFQDDGTVFGEGNSVSVTLSHEVIEAFVDPDVNLWADDCNEMSWAYEACDPVEASSYPLTTKQGRVYVSNFVLRSWFDSENLEGTRFDHMGLLRRPFQVLKDGYAVYWDGKKEHTKYGPKYPRWRKAGKSHFLARTARRGCAEQAAPLPAHRHRR